MSFSSPTARDRAAHGLSVISALAVALLLLLPAPAGPPGWLADRLPAALSDHLDKGVHVALFFALAAVWRRSFDRLVGLARPVASTVLLAAGYGAALEGLQALTPDRSTSPGDAAANLLGALLYGAVVARSRRLPENP